MSDQPWGAGLDEPVEKGERQTDPGVRRLRQTVSPTVTAGVPGTAVFGGYVEQKERDRDLWGRKRYETYGNMLANTSIVAAGVRYFMNLIAKPDWKFEPADESPEAERYAELLTEMIGDMDTPWRRVVRRAAGYRFYGFSVQEWTAKIRPDGIMAFADVAPRPQFTIERWDCTPDGRILGMIQVSPQDYSEIYLPRNKVIYVVDDSIQDSPEGMGLFRHIVEGYRRLKRYEQLEGYGFESDLRGVPVGRAPIAELDRMVKNGELSEEQKTSILQPMEDFLKGHIKNPALSILLDSMTYESQDEAQRPSSARQWDMELLSSTSATQAEIARTIDRINREMARVLGVEHMLLGDNGVGSFAMAKEKSHSFALIVDSTGSEIAEAFKDDFVRRVFMLNGWPVGKMPTIKIDKIQTRTIEEITTALEQMARAGVPVNPNDPAVNEVYNLMGLSQPEVINIETDMALMPEDPPEPQNEMPEEGDDNG